MTGRLHSGLYEDLLTSALEAEINARTAEGWWVDVTSADATVRPEFLARHVYHLLRRALEAIPEEDGTQSANQVALANRLVEVLVEHGVTADDRVADAARLILEAVEHRVLGGTQSAIPRPTLSLRQTGLLVNGRRDVQIASEIAREIPSADRIAGPCSHSASTFAPPAIKILSQDVSTFVSRVHYSDGALEFNASIVMLLTVAEAGSAREASRPASLRERAGQVFACNIMGRCGIGVGFQETRR